MPLPQPPLRSADCAERGLSLFEVEPFFDLTSFDPVLHVGVMRFITHPFVMVVRQRGFFASPQAKNVSGVRAPPS
jgi:hypothetical protein